MNAEELAAIKARHPDDLASYDSARLAEIERWHRECLRPCTCWGRMALNEPCETALWIAEVERLQEGLRAILREHRKITETIGRQPQCCTCNPQEKRWPCTTVLEARAALGEQSTGPTLEGRTDDAG